MRGGVWGLDTKEKKELNIRGENLHNFITYSNFTVGHLSSFSEKGKINANSDKSTERRHLKY